MAALSVFAAGLPVGCVPFSPWPRAGALLLVRCPSRLAAGAAARRAALFGLAVAGPVALSRSRWLVAVRWVARPPAPRSLSVRFAAPLFPRPAPPAPPWCVPFGPPLPPLPPAPQLQGALF